MKDDYKLHDFSRKIPILLFGTSALIFNLQDIQKLRLNYGIIGVFSGTLPLAPQQNLLLGLPLRLSIYEIIYLINLNLAYLIPSELGNPISIDDETDHTKEFKEQLQLQNSLKENELKAKMNKLGLEYIPKDNKDFNEQSFFIEIPNTNNDNNNSIMENIKTNLNQKIILAELIRKYINLQPNELFLNNYKTFNFLKSKNQVILPGLRFGGTFLSYPGDPLRYHAHYIVSIRNYKTDDIGLLDITVGGRLATGVKKMFVVSGEKDENENFHHVKSQCVDSFVDKIISGEKFKTVCFSFEWAGFG